MIVTIAGCGALGSLFAARLTRGGLKVQALQRRGAQQDALREKGIVAEWGDEGARPYRLATVSDDPAQLERSDLIVVTLKAHSTGAANVLKDVLAPEGLILTLQNGLGNAERLAAAFGPERVVAGVAMYGANALAPGVVRLAGEGYVELGPWQPGIDVGWVVQALDRAGLRVRFTGDPRPALWEKLWLNSIVNPTSALTGMRNGELLKNTAALDLMAKLGQETVIAGSRAGILLDFEGLWARAMDTLEWSAPTKPSMRQDVELGRQTEIEAISGGVLAYARSADEFPYTRAVYALVKAIDEQHMAEQ
jgi:2-dehydropantoate 2-reductase